MRKPNIPVISEPALNGNQHQDSPKQILTAQVDHVSQQLNQLNENQVLERADLLLKLAAALTDLKEPYKAWTTAKEAFTLFIEVQEWQKAVKTCAIMYKADQPDSLCALGHAVWLAVTFPVDIDLTIEVLNHIIDDTPDDYDAAALAAATAMYLTDIRATEKEHENLSFFAGNILAQVARRHSAIENQDDLESWVKRLELDDPSKFLPRLRNVLNILVSQDDWWIDTDAIHQLLPEG
ncbi:MAG: hypothetical protein HOM11_06370 [Methylococcales bacterium]|jgi:hypothetical protein|nr:hypothetical protein [Methylococcales bacterium]MBT7444109.1 hypothetical protein [Methylococcales bacterium]